MQESITIDLTIQAMILVLILSMPAILLSTLAGLGISLLQALTQIQEQTLAFAVKLIVATAALILTANFMAVELFNFTEFIFSSFHTIGR